MMHLRFTSVSELVKGTKAQARFFINQHYGSMGALRPLEKDVYEARYITDNDILKFEENFKNGLYGEKRNTTEAERERVKNGIFTYADPHGLDIHTQL